MTVNSGNNLVGLNSQVGTWNSYRQLPPLKDTRLSLKKVMGFDPDDLTKRSIQLKEKEG